MTKLLLSIVLTFIFGVSAFSQNTVPLPTPTPRDDPDVVRISTNLVQVDVTVTDRDGKVVRDLRPGEIEIYQNGKKQEISNFLFMPSTRVTVDGSAAKAKSVQQPAATIPPPSPIRAENVKRTIALVVDDLNLSFQSTNYVQQALKKFVDQQMLDGDLVAIIRTGAGIGVCSSLLPS